MECAADRRPTQVLPDIQPTYPPSPSSNNHQFSCMPLLLFSRSLYCVTFHHVNFQLMAPATFSRRHLPAFPPICSQPYVFRSTQLFAVGERLTCKKYVATFYFENHLKGCLFFFFFLNFAFLQRSQRCPPLETQDPLSTTHFLVFFLLCRHIMCCFHLMFCHIPLSIC